MPLPLSALAGSPFETYLWPGVILFTVLGLGPLIAARLVWTRHRLASLAAFVVGAARVGSFVRGVGVAYGARTRNLRSHNPKPEPLLCAWIVAL